MCRFSEHFLSLGLSFKVLGHQLVFYCGVHSVIYLSGCTQPGLVPKVCTCLPKVFVDFLKIFF